jgi:hypothetical protein
MNTQSVFDSDVKGQAGISDSRTQLLHYIEAEIDAAYNFAAERELYASWLRHGLAPPEHVSALMSAEHGGLQ